MPTPLTLPMAHAGAEAADRLLARCLLGGAIVMLIIFFAPWMIRPTRVLFTWNLLKGGSLGRVVFLLWIPIAALNLLALRFLPGVPPLLRAGIAAAVGVVPLTALCLSNLTFGQSPAAFPDTVGYGLLAAAPLIAFGLQHRIAHRSSRVAHVAVALGAALIVLSMLWPRETQEGVSAPVIFLFEHAPMSAGWAGLAVYLVLPVPLALLALAALLDTQRFDKLLRVLLFYFLRFIPGLFLLLAFPAFTAEKEGFYRPYILFVGAIITTYLTCLVAGTSALLAHGALARAQRATRGHNPHR